MTELAGDVRDFRVHARHADGQPSRLVEETSFEAAAVAYLEGHHLEAPPDEEAGISIIVREVATGHEHCFRVNLESGIASPCD